MGSTGIDYSFSGMPFVQQPQQPSPRTKRMMSQFERTEISSDHEDSAASYSSDNSNSSSHIKKTDPSKCVQLNRKRSDLHKFYGLVNPNTMELNAESFAMARILVPTPYGPSVQKLTIDPDQPKAILTFQRSTTMQDPSLIIGCLPSQKKADPSHVLTQKIIEHFNSQRSHIGDSISASITFNLPFVAEPEPSGKLLEHVDAEGNLLGKLTRILFRKTPKDNRERKSRDYAKASARSVLFVVKKRDSNYMVDRRAKILSEDAPEEDVRTPQTAGQENDTTNKRTRSSNGHESHAQGGRGEQNEEEQNENNGGDVSIRSRHSVV